MIQYIDKAKVVAEIERLKAVFKSEKEKEKASKTDKLSLGARIAMLEELNVFFDTIEVKEMDLENDIKNAFKAGYELGIQQKTQKGE